MKHPLARTVDTVEVDIQPWRFSGRFDHIANDDRVGRRLCEGCDIFSSKEASHEEIEGLSKEGAVVVAFCKHTLPPCRWMTAFTPYNTLTTGESDPGPALC